MTSRLVATALAGLALLLAACDNNSSTPTSPSGGTLQVTAARSTLRAGEAAPLTVTAANGTPVTLAAWTTTDTTVLTVSPAGIATAGRAGRVTVTATATAGTGSIALRVVPDYQGIWTGGVARPQITCSATSSSALCVPGAATSGTLSLSVLQTGDQLTGTLIDSAEPSAQVPLIGTVQADDSLAFAGRLDTPASTPARRVDVSAMRGTLDVVLGSLTGSYQLLVERAPAAGGSLQTDYRIQTQFRDLRR